MGVIYLLIRYRLTTVWNIWLHFDKSQSIARAKKCRKKELNYVCLLYVYIFRQNSAAATIADYVRYNPKVITVTPRNCDNVVISY